MHHLSWHSQYFTKATHISQHLKATLLHHPLMATLDIHHNNLITIQMSKQRAIKINIKDLLSLILNNQDHELNMWSLLLIHKVIILADWVVVMFDV